MTNTESEKYLERKLTDKVKKLKGKAFKFWCISFTGMPDRMILLPGGRIRFAEIKSTGKPLKPRQKIVIPWLRSLGFIVTVIDTVEKLNEFLNELENDLQTT
ncbi:VRR-NUC domain-containing protein [Chitinophaga sp. CC14]|uniref:VRR-NUC domain-containing protein n=1 Tax=Chitinophaga sp. CC14 TaxID=3029199 RepID=UPI003B7B7C83